MMSERYVKALSKILLASVVFYNHPLLANQAQPVPIPEDPSSAPQIEIDGVGIGTVGAGQTSENKKTQGAIYFNDSALLLGASQRLHYGGIGSLGIGGVTTDESVKGKGNSLFLHQAFVDYQTASFEALIGRSDNPSAHIVDFPTLRGDDLITLTNPLNPFSNGGNIEEHRYANVAQISFNQNLTYFENFHVQHLINSAGIGTETGINSFGASFEYMAPPGLEAFYLFPSWSLGFEHITIKEQSPDGIYQFFVGGVMNLNESVTDRIDLRAQNILSIGNKMTGFKTITDTYQADSNNIAVSLRYLNSPFGKPGYQIALTAAYKDYIKVEKAKSYGWALTVVKRLGQGFDLVAQYQGQQRETRLASIQSSGLSCEQTLEVGFVFDFNATFNRHISPRRTLLNQQHHYIPD